ncbi:MAG: PVC-type heme-binding CxxCH protein [Verrucomicrobiota bacterium]
MIIKIRFCSLLLLAALAVKSSSAPPAGPLELHARARQTMPGGSNQFQVVEKVLHWEPRRTAIIICDMWDQHWCRGATARVAEMAPRMNEVIREARRRGVLIIHAPSGTMDFYAQWPQRKRAQQAPKANPPADVSQWQALNKAKEPPLPIDDSDGGCDDEPSCPQGGPWRRQIAALEIGAEDAISDNGEEVYNLLQESSRENVIIMGVHENMCVLGRPFSIRQMVTVGKNVVLMRDMTDTMYNSRRFPYVSHFVGTDLVAVHIEKYWCATIASTDILGGKPFHFEADRRKTIAFVLAENEYHSWETLPDFAQAELASRGFALEYINAPPMGGNEFTNAAALANADLVIVSARRRTPPASLLQALRRHLDSRKPLIGLRTASHAFAAKPPDSGHGSWDTFDRDILGATYEGHYGNELTAQIEPAAEAAAHPILTGVPAVAFISKHSLYRSRQLAPTTMTLLRGQVTSDGQVASEPVAWINTNAQRRVFYTSLGGPQDFKEPAFRRVLLNAVLWSLEQPVPPASAATASTAKYETEWQPLRVPGTWEENEPDHLRDYDGMAWYRCLVKIPDSWQGQPVDFWIERVDNAHEVYVNGEKIGGAGSMPPAYQNGDTAGNRYRIQARDLHAGDDNLISVRVYDEGGRGGFKGDAPALLTSDEAIKLEGNWQFRLGDNLQWAKATGAAQPPRYSQVIDAAGVSARTSLHQVQEQPFGPADSLARFTVADDLQIEEVLAEPIVRQPVFMQFDERGRLWVVQYLQYPEPAGIKMLSRDNVWRAVYDKVPPPPPHHFPGADKITIHEDTDGDGRFDRHKTFVEGLNLVTSVARGRGGVWVLNPPYLLFYPDKNDDDIPDSDPELRLAGFGLEDTHSIANSLRWGPDGWLYGCQGSTVTGNILVYGANGLPLNAKPIYSQGQNIWRYHPAQRRYEVFAEGGGNAFGLEIDAQGRAFSGHNGGNTRGFHYMQGAYLQKGFEKHGPLSNPYAFGYFPPMPHNQAERFTHNFIIYDGGSLPSPYNGKLFGVEPLQGRIVLSSLEPDFASFRTTDLSYPVTTTDRWFRPVDIKVGPDGAIYIADWYDRQVNHYRNHQGEIDKDHGRIYRLRAKSGQAMGAFDLEHLSDTDFLGILRQPNKWFRQEALRLLADRPRPALAAPLAQMLRTSTGQPALEALWALNLAQPLSEEIALECLSHREPQVRAWTVRLIGDQTSEPPPQLAARLAALARSEGNVEVRAQLACTSKRLAARPGLAIVNGLLTHDEDAGDPRLPLLIWWAIESKAEADADAVLALLSDATAWRRPLVQNQLLERLMRRYAQAGTRKDLLVCAQLFQLAPETEQARKLMGGFELAFKGRAMTGLPDELVQAMAKAGGDSLPWAVRRGQTEAVEKALRIITDSQAGEARRLEYIRLFGEVAQPQSVRVLLGLLRPESGAAICKSVLAALKLYKEPQIGETVAQVLPSLSPEVQTSAFVLLASRAVWAKALLAAVASGSIERSAVPQDVNRRLQLYSDPEVAELVRKHLAAARVPTNAEMQKRIADLSATLRSGSGSPYEGQKVFTMTCAVCHKLFGQGGQIGPDLTTYKRDEIENMLLHIVNPSAEIREGYENFLLSTKDGQTFSGFLADKDNRVVVLRGLDGENNVVPQDQIAEIKAAGASLMPEGLLDVLNEQQVRDLFAYLRSTQPLVR